MGIYENIVGRVLLEKGWSGDRKYCAETADGSRYLLRISPMDSLPRKRKEFERMQAFADLGIAMCQPMEFGAGEEGVYTILSWIDGTDAEESIPSIDEAAQYRYGLDAGRMLSKLHSIPASPDAADWEQRFNAKIDRKITMYESCQVKYACDGQAFLEYIRQNRHLLAGRPQCYQHGDYHIGNMMIDAVGKLVIIDFEKQDVGDPWEEFNRIVWSAQAAPAFAAGMVDGYFGGSVPMAFWRLLALYISSNTLGSLPWAIPFGQQEIQVMQKQAAQVLQWYDGMKHVVPTWYRSCKRTVNLELELYVPKPEDLWFYQKMMADPDTMAYNAGYDLDFPGYHRDTGCIDYTDEHLSGWHSRWIGQEPERFYAYIRRRSDGAWIGDVNFHYTPEMDWYDMGIVIYAPYRGMGYGTPALKLLLERAFRVCGVRRLHNEFETTRNAAWAIHRKLGFRETARRNDMLQLILTKEDYENQTL